MEKKIRFGLIGIGAQGGAYAGFLTGKAGLPGMPAPECPPHCELGALCDIDPEKEKMCKEKYPEFPFFTDWKEMVASGTCRRSDHHSSALPAYRDRYLLPGARHERTGRETGRRLRKSCS